MGESRQRLRRKGRQLIDSQRASSRHPNADQPPTHVVRDAALNGVRAAAGIPSWVLVTGYLGFGALAAGHQLSLLGTLLSTLTIWALPGQLILVEMHTLGASFFVILLTVTLSAIRFLPMTVAFMPLLREARVVSWRHYAAAHLLSISGWAWCMSRLPEMPPAQRLAYYFGFTLTLMVSSLIASWIGYVAGDLLPANAQLAFVLMSPIYFLLILSGETRTGIGRLALVAGAICGPLVHLVSAQWSVLLSGVIGGSVAWWLHRYWQHKTRQA